MNLYLAQHPFLLWGNIAILLIGSILFLFTYYVLAVRMRAILVWAAGFAVSLLCRVILRFTVGSEMLTAFFLLLFSVSFIGALLIGIYHMLGLAAGIHRLVKILVLVALVLLALLAVASPWGLMDGWFATLWLVDALLLAVGTNRALRTDRKRSRLPLYIAMALYAGAFLYGGLLLLLRFHDHASGLLYSLSLALVASSLVFLVLRTTFQSIHNVHTRQKLLIENTSYGLAFLSEDGRVLMVNDRMMEILGVPWDQKKKGRPTLEQSGLQKLGPGLLSDDCESAQIELADDGGNPQTLQVTSRPTLGELGGKPGRFVQVQDITKARQAQLATEYQVLRREMLLRSIGAVEYNMDEDGTVHAQELFSLLGYCVEQMRHAEIVELVHPQDRTRILAEAHNNKEQTTFQHDMRIRHADGQYLWFQVSGKQVEIDSKRMMIGIALCIEERKRMEFQMIQSEKLNALGQLAGGVTHDMNNHLMTLQTSLNMMERTEDSGKRRKYAGYMQEAINNSGALLRSLLAFSRGEKESYSPVDMEDMVSVTLGLLERALPIRVHLAREDTAGSAMVLGNYYELQNVLLNLGLNARDAMAGVGEICVRSTIVDTNPRMPGYTGSWYCLSVSDDGCGMDDDTQRHIFDPFFTTKAVGSGSGLGLSITYGIVNRHGGTIDVLSQPGQGTTFTLHLPIATEQDLTRDNRQSVPQATEEPEPEETMRRVSAS